MLFLRKSLRYTIRFFLGILFCIGAYFLTAWLMTFFRSNSEADNQNGEIPVYIVSNGVHTDIVMPVRTDGHDWRSVFPLNHTLSADSSYEFIAVGWGDKKFYTETPTWGDLTVSTSFQAAFGLGSGAVHSSYYFTSPEEGERCRRINLSMVVYSKLVKSILADIPTRDGCAIHIDHAGYGSYDAFYESTCSYSMFKTCNVWTGSKLKSVGIGVAPWTPFPWGVFAQL